MEHSIHDAPKKLFLQKIDELFAEGYLSVSYEDELLLMDNPFAYFYFVNFTGTRGLTPLLSRLCPALTTPQRRQPEMTR